MRTLFLACIIFLAACASIKRSPSQNAVLRSKNTIESTRLDSLKIANSKKEYALLARYNPGKCDCPKFEVFAYGEWRRSQFSGTKSILKASRKYANSGIASLKNFKIRGRFSGKKEVAPNGVIYEAFQLTKFDY